MDSLETYSLKGVPYRYFEMGRPTGSPNKSQAEFGRYDMLQEYSILGWGQCLTMSVSPCFCKTPHSSHGYPPMAPMATRTHVEASRLKSGRFSPEQWTAADNGASERR